ncbi:Gag-Pol polyprotein [Bienertia sinuspersici]
MYEVSHRGDQCVVDLAQRTCSCYQWDLTGVPCVHANRSILDQREDPYEFVSEFYSIATFLRAYEQPINPMPGINHWEKQNLPHPLPPEEKKMPGRPKLHKRRKEKGEDDDKKQKLGKSKKTITCSKCGQQGHTCTKCKTPTPERMPKKKGGRPPTDNAWAKDQRKRKEQRVIRKVNLYWLVFSISMS